MKRKSKILFVGLSPIQNARPFRLLAECEHLDTTVLYLRPSADGFLGEEFINRDAFDTTTLTGYQYEIATPVKGAQQAGPLLGLSLDPWRYASAHEIVVVYGHFLISYWLAIFGAKCHGRHLVLSTDATSMQGSAQSRGWKLRLKPFFFRWLYNWLADAVFVPSTASKAFLVSLGVRAERITVTPYVVDEPQIEAASEQTDVPRLRSKLGIPESNLVFVFCAKFLARKRPLDAINAFACLDREDTTLLMIGSGPLEAEVQARIEELGLENKVVLAGLVKYSELPSYYTASDVLVFCSDHEPYGLPVNEMMLCGHPVIVSDRIGARLDLVEEGVTGWVYPVGNIERLAGIMRMAADDKSRLRTMGEQAKTKMKGWTSEVHAARQLELFEERGWIQKAGPAQSTAN